MRREVVADREHLFSVDGVAFGERDVNSGGLDDDDGEDLCSRLSLPVRGGEGEAIVCAGVKGKNLPGVNSLSFHHCPQEIREHTL